MSANPSPSTAANSASDAGKSSAANEAFDRLRRDFNMLKDDVRTIWNDAREAARQQSQQGLDRSRTVAAGAADSALGMKSALEDTIRRHPLAAVGIALGAGLILAGSRRR